MGGAFVNVKVSPSGALQVNSVSPFESRSDTFTTAASGTTIDTSLAPLKYYSLQVKGTGASATTWDVRLEGSLDNVNFSQLIQHTNVTGDGAVLWLGTAAASFYIRSRCAAVALGSATNIVVTLVGMN